MKYGQLSNVKKLGKITDLCIFYGKLTDLSAYIRSVTLLTDLCDHTYLNFNKGPPRRDIQNTDLCRSLQIYD